MLSRAAEFPAGRIRIPQTTILQSRYDFFLITACMTVNEDFSVFGITDREAWCGVIMGGAARTPATPSLASAKRSGYNFR